MKKLFCVLFVLLLTACAAPTGVGGSGLSIDEIEKKIADVVYDEDYVTVNELDGEVSISIFYQDTNYEDYKRHVVESTAATKVMLNKLGVKGSSCDVNLTNGDELLLIWTTYDFEAGIMISTTTDETVFFTLDDLAN